MKQPQPHTSLPTSTSLGGAGTSIPAPGSPPRPGLSFSSTNTITSHMTVKEYAKHVCLWSDPVLTVKVFLFFVTLWHFTRTGDDLPNYSYVSFFAATLLSRVVIVSIPQIAAKQLASYPRVQSIADMLSKAGKFIGAHTSMPSDKDVEYWVSGVADIVETKAKAASKAVTQAESDERMFKVVIFNIFAVILVSWIVSLRTIFFAVVFGSLTLPVIYKRFHKEIDNALEVGLAKVNPYVEQVEQKGKEIGEIIGKKMNEGFGTVKVKYEEFRKTTSEKAKAAINKKA